MLELVPAFGSRRWAIRRDGADIVELKMSLMREGAEFAIDRVPHEITRKGLMSAVHTLSRDGLPVAQARALGAFRTGFDVEHEGSTYRLTRPGLLARGFEVSRDGQRIGSIAPRKLLSNRSDIDLPDDVDLALQLFLAALLIFQWDREASAGAAT